MSHKSPGDDWKGKGGYVWWPYHQQKERQLWPNFWTLRMLLLTGEIFEDKIKKILSSYIVWGWGSRRAGWEWNHMVLTRERQREIWHTAQVKTGWESTEVKMGVVTTHQGALAATRWRTRPGMDQFMPSASRKLGLFALSPSPMLSAVDLKYVKMHMLWPLITAHFP